MSEDLRQQHEKQITSTREALVDKFENDISSLEDNVLLDTIMFLSKDSVSSTLQDYLTSDGIGDMIQDKLLGLALRKSLAGDKLGESQGLALFDKIQSARDALLTLERTKAKENFSDQLQVLHQEFGLSGLLNHSDIQPPAISESDEISETSDIVDITGKRKILFSDVASSPYEKGVTATLCSATTQKNAKDIFAVVIPSGHAQAAQDLDVSVAMKDSNDRVISSETKDAYIASVLGKDAFSHAPVHASMADVFVKSSNKYGHRCLAFKKFPQNEWYILDPYRAPDGKSEKPKKLSDYAKKNTIIKVNFYQTDSVVVDSLEQEDQFA